MALRLCPECDARTPEVVCPTCGSRTLRERDPADHVDPLLGRVLEGRYRLESMIGRGGMGAVYKGVQLATKQVVAVKVILSEHAENTDAVKRFHREARAASLLSHPHSIRVVDFGQADDGTLYMALEYLAGRTLAKALTDEGVFTERRIAKVAGEVAQSLAEAHAAGLVHRDLKPENVMLLDVFGDPDFVKVLDFGIAKLVTGSGESNVTREGVVVGTPYYMAPEQAQAGGGAVTTAIDVYALGVMVYQALSGTMPFDGDSPLQIVFSHVQSQVPELAPDAGVSEPMRRLVRRMLAKEPSERPTAADLVAAFDRLRLGVEASTRATPPPVDVTLSPDYGALDDAVLGTRRSPWWLLAGALLLLALGAAAFFFWRGSAPADGETSAPTPAAQPAVVPVAPAPAPVVPAPALVVPAPVAPVPEAAPPAPIVKPAPEAAPSVDTKPKPAVRVKTTPKAPTPAAPKRSKYRSLD